MLVLQQSHPHLPSSHVVSFLVPEPSKGLGEAVPLMALSWLQLLHGSYQRLEQMLGCSFITAPSDCKVPVSTTVTPSQALGCHRQSSCFKSAQPTLTMAEPM